MRVAEFPLLLLLGSCAACPQPPSPGLLQEIRELSADPDLVSAQLMFASWLRDPALVDLAVPFAASTDNQLEGSVWEALTLTDWPRLAA